MFVVYAVMYMTLSWAIRMQELNPEQYLRIYLMIGYVRNAVQ